MTVPSQEEIAAMPDEQMGEPDPVAYLLCRQCGAPRTSMLRKLTLPDGTLGLEMDIVCSADPKHQAFDPFP